MRNIVEDFDPATNVEGGSIDINDEAVVDAINRNISAVTASSCVTPYVKLEKIRKILAYYKIFIPHTVFLEGDEGNEVFEISQFGEKFGVTNDGEFKSKNDDDLYLYFEWMTNDDGMIDVFAEIVDEDDLEELLADFDEEGEEEENDDSDGAEPTHDIYKAANMREDYDKGAAYDAKELKNIGSGKVSRKSDKKIQRRFKRAGVEAAKKAVTGMEPGRKGKKGLGEETDKPPFEGGYKIKGSKKDRYGNVIKTKNIAKHLAKMAMKKKK